MTKKRNKLDNNQLSLFELIKSYTEESPAARPAGCFNIDRLFREAVSDSLRKCPLSRYQVAARMSELLDVDITKTMLDSWTAESKEQHRFPALFLPAFCEAVGTAEPLKMLGSLVGLFIMPGPEALRAEIRRIDEEITKKQADKRQMGLF